MQSGAAADGFAAIGKSSYDDVARSLHGTGDGRDADAARVERRRAGHFLDTKIFPLETFFYENPWRWCVVSGTDDVDAQGVAENQEGARPDAVTRAADHRAAAASLVRALFARGSFDEG